MDDNTIYEIKGIRYRILLGEKGCKPCELCDLRRECETDDDFLIDDLPCGCAFLPKPYYCKKVNDNEQK